MIMLLWTVPQSTYSVICSATVELIEDLKQALTEYHQPFHLHVHKKDDYAFGILK